MEQAFFTDEKVMILEPKVSIANSDIITEFNVTTDSVVATVTLKFRSGTKQVRVDWGNGKSTRLRLDRITSVLNSGTVIMLPDGRFEFRHIYEAPADGSTFSTAILVKASNNSNDDFRIQQVNIIPRYQVHFADVYFRLLQPGDFHEAHSEWSITMRARHYTVGTFNYEPLGTDRTWGFDSIPESFTPTPWYKLPGSGRGLNMGKGDIMYAYFSFTEIDLISDDLFSITINLDITKTTDGIYLKDATNSMEIRFYQQVQLLKPMPNNNDWAVLEN
jgi:hypothetical protein